MAWVAKPTDLKKVKVMKVLMAEFVRTVEAAGAEVAARRSELAGAEAQEKLNVASKATFKALSGRGYAKTVESWMRNIWCAAWTLEKDIKRVFR
ncbi:MAG: hypothetical protein LE180_05515 [Endomicrobium sp.]|uniref:hypothetical protein n=1 Tax=Candidatus Endomicrobiellum pyrsonymphae TaxID=1408203 RepID=UPI0035763EC8|nr:hypothetical protein [Endomicrobium sp.]